MENRFYKNDKGITLIALVITIIVLLILAGVAISMLSGENGILRQAAIAKTNSDVAKLSESIKLAATTAMTTVEHKLTEENFKTELEKEGYRVNEDGTVTESNVKYALTNKGAVKGTIEDLKKEQTAVLANTKLEDENGHTITIPMSFNISSESPVLVTEGIIIEDSMRNQYVWIPVFEYDEANCSWGAKYPETLPDKTADKSEFTASNISALKTALRGNSSTGYTKDYYSSNNSDVWYGNSSYGKYGYYDGTKFNYYTNGNMTEQEYNSLYNNMLISVYKNGGFYIGRYEMGTAVVDTREHAMKNTRTEDSLEYVPSKVTDSSDKTTNYNAEVKISEAPVIKKNAVPYIYITQSQAQMLAEKLGEKSDYTNVTSSILFGVQWDMVCVFLEHYGKVHNDAKINAGEIFTIEYLKNATQAAYWGNYEDSNFKMDRGFYCICGNTLSEWKNSTTKNVDNEWLCTTGASDQNSALNIYDFGGNVAEWTLERGSSLPCARSGGYCLSPNSVAYTNSLNTDAIRDTTSSRVTFFLK